MVVGRTGRSQERGAGEPGGCHLLDPGEAEHPDVEVEAARQVADVENCVVEPDDRHDSTVRPRRYVSFVLTISALLLSATLIAP